MQIPAYVQNVPADPNPRCKIGNVNVSTNDATHNAETAIDTPNPRTRFGNNSEINTQVTGASDNA